MLKNSDWLNISL